MFDLCSVCGAYWHCEHAAGLEDPALSVISDADAWGHAEEGRQRDLQQWILAYEREKRQEECVWRAARTLEQVQADTAVVIAAVNEQFTPFMEMIAQLGLQIVEGFTAALKPFSEALERVNAELNPPPSNNRAGRRRRHVPPSRPGWMQAFPPTHPSRVRHHVTA